MAVSGIWLPSGSEAKKEREALEADDGGVGKALVETGLLETGEKFTYVCPVCGNRVTNDQRMEPACTGASWRDEHPITPMRLIQ